MKKVITLVALTLVFITNGCRNEDSLVTGKVSLSLSQVGTTSGRLEMLRNVDKIVLTIQNDSGDKVVDSKELAVRTLNDDYVTDDIELPVGKFRLTYFQVIDTQNKVIAATPIEGSQLASLVSDPLPIEFQVKEQETIALAVEIINTENISAGDLGYASFALTSKDFTVIYLNMSDQNVDKLEYQLIGENEVIEGVSDFEECILNFNKPELIGKTYVVTLKLWFKENNGFKRVNWYRARVNFNGDIIKLPAFTDSKWGEYYFKQVDEFKVYWGTDPRSSDYRVLIEQNPGRISSGYVDRTYYKPGGEAFGEGACGTVIRSIDLGSEISGPLVELDFPEPCITDELNYDMDSFVDLVFQGQLKIAVFRWEVRNGSILPVDYGY